MNFGIAKALRDTDIETFTIPVIPDQSLPFPQTWLGRAKDLYRGIKFDQVWVWLLHYPYDQDTLDWIRTIAPIRVGILGESMRYESQDYALEPRLKERPVIIRHQIQGLTHLLVGDENDAIEIAGWGEREVLWWPGGVPGTYIDVPAALAPGSGAVFHGNPYGSRLKALRHPRLQRLLSFPNGNGTRNEFQELFDDIQLEMEKTLGVGQFVPEQDLRRYILMLDQVRQGEFTKWMKHLHSWDVIVNLPSFAKFYGGRVFEALAAGRPVISWKIPNHPRNNALFEDGKEILLYSKDDSDALADHIERLLGDPSFGLQLVLRAQHKLRKFHTVEKRVRDTLQWITSGREPCYEENIQVQTFSLNSPESVYRAPKMESELPQEYEEMRQLLLENTAFDKADVPRLVLTHGEKESLSEKPKEQLSQKGEEEQFYTDLFVRSGTWSTPYPNTDERMRWEKIKEFLPEITARLKSEKNEPARILDVGCGRGWLTNLLASFGTCEGIEPVELVVEYGRKLFPDLTLHVGYPESLLAQEDFTPYDLIVTSEVIEHIPHAQKTNFVVTLKKLLKPKGAVILTTPRKEVWEQWRSVSNPNQPIEDWITEPDLCEIFRETGFHELGRERIYFDLPKFQYVAAPSSGKEVSSPNIIALYQIWAFGTEKFYQDLQNHQRSLGDVLPSKQAFEKSVVFGKEHAGCPVISQNSELSAQARNPLVSVIVPTFNRRDTLRTALQSIMDQTFTDYEIIVINDAGVEVEDIVLSFNAGKNVTSIRHSRNRGLAAARNSGLGVARGKYIAYLDDDDRFACNHLETLVSFLEEGQYQVAYTDAWQIVQQKKNGVYTETGRHVPYSQDFNADKLLLCNYFPVLCMMHEKACLEKTGNFDETLTTHEDWDLWIRLSRHYTFAHIKKITAEFTWRFDGSSMTSCIPSDFLRTKRVIYKKYDEYFRLRPHLIPAREQELQNLERQVNPFPFACSIIIPVFNKVELTRQCLMQLAEVTMGIPYEVVIVDNQSTDGTREFLESLGGDVQIIRNTENLGFAKACNQGAQAARGKHLVFLNNDTIPRSGWLDALIHEVDSHSDVDVVGSKLLYPDNTIQHAGVVISRLYRTPYHIFLQVPEDLPAVNMRKEFQAVTAACMLVRREAFEKVGGFDEGFVNGFEDVDLCLKIRQMGRKIIYQPQSCLYHLESQTPGRKTHDVANAKRLLSRWEHRWLVDEDLVAYQSGYIIQQTVSDEKLQSQLTPIKNNPWTVSWRRVVELQAFLLGRECQPLSEMSGGQRIRDLLAEVDEWPQDIGILEWAGRVCESLGCEQESRSFWQKLLSMGDHPNARLGLAKGNLKDGKLDEAQRHLDVLCTVFTPRAEGWCLQGILFMQKQQHARAKQAFKQSLALEAANKKSQMGLGMACLGLEQYAEAWNIFESMIAIEPDNVQVMRCLLQAGTALERWDVLAGLLLRFVERNPADCDMRFALAGVYLRAGQITQAQEQCTMLTALKPEYEGLQELQMMLQHPGHLTYAMAK